MIINILLIALGFVLLIKGADVLVEGSSNIAKKFHIPEIVVGLTIVSIGTSMPELFVSTTSALKGHSDMAIGNVIGSNICNLLLILGLSATLKEIEFKLETKNMEIPMCIFFTSLFFFLGNLGGKISRIDSIILLVFFSCFIVYTILVALVESKEIKKNFDNINVFKSMIYIIVGIFALKFGGDLVVNNSVKLAEMFNISEKLISLTIIAIGTSLPELVTSVTAAAKGSSEIAIGNIIGSNIFNILLIIGVTGIIKPITYSMDYNMQVIYLLISTLLLGLYTIIGKKNIMTRGNGFVYLLMYVGYMVFLFFK